MELKSVHHVALCGGISLVLLVIISLKRSTFVNGIPILEEEFNMEKDHVKDTKLFDLRRFHELPTKNIKDKVSKTIAIEAKISSEGVIVKIDNVEVYQILNKTLPWGHTTARVHAGFHLLVLHQRSGQVMRKTSYMTWQPEIHKQLKQALSNIRNGRLVILIGSPEFTEFLNEKVLQQIESFGSKYVKGFTMYDQWCFIGWKGKKVLHEALTTAKVKGFGSQDVSPLSVHFVAPLSTVEEPCGWYSNDEMQERSRFCETYDDYGDFCNCLDTPWSLNPENPPLYTSDEEIPLAIVTSRRLPHVLSQLGQIRRSPGGSKTSITIFVDGYNPEARDMGRLLGIPVVEHNNPLPIGSTMRVNNHVKFALQNIFDRHVDAKLAIILEDDLELAPDFIPYFHQAAKAMLSDSKLLFVNAFNYNSYTHTAHDPSKLYRAHGIPGYGWMTTRWGAQEMLKNWAGTNQTGVVWDWWIRSRMIGTWDMLIPEVPRTQHMGGGGVHITGYDQILFSVQPLNNLMKVQLDVDSVKKGVYDEYLHGALGSAKVVNIKKHPCDVIPIPKRQTGKSYVIYIHQPDERREHHSFYVIALCLGINDRDPHESYNMMTTFPFHGNQVFVVYCPNSPYCQPKDPRLIYRATEEDAVYAKNNQYPRAKLKMSYALRITPNNPEEEFELRNRYLVKYEVQ